MKTEVSKKSYWSIVRINFILLLIFTLLNDMDYFSTYFSILDWWIEINPVVIFMLEYPLIFFLWKILLLPMIVWHIAYESESKKVMWSMVVVNLVYLWVVWGNLRVVF